MARREKLARARILIRASDGWVEQDIAQVVEVLTGTVERKQRRDATEGLDAATMERRCADIQRKLDRKQEAHLITVACCAAPRGCAEWVLKLLTDKAVELRYSIWK